MRFIGQGRKRFVAAAVALLFAAGAGIAVAATSPPPSNAMRMGHGINEYGMTQAFFKGHQVRFTYSLGFFCDKRVTSFASSGCEAGAKAKKAPSKDFDTLFVTVPLGFNLPARKMDCPTNLVCVDHPGTIDLTRLEPALKPLYPDLTVAQLTDALKNAATPGHQHFITTRAHGNREWWDVKVVGVTNKAEYNKITRHRSAAFLKREIKAGRTTAAIPTNLFLFFAVK
ncbi:hypothetical protein [Nocardioides terrisoli]|uniref:hypothetical protein n=1 Tax=Nocardioides terrisoli TaxID=3388267 RepID=UPI00287B601F|nr:hypothetical protein [Nocardioides marmorisolisilvae]